MDAHADRDDSDRVEVGGGERTLGIERALDGSTRVREDDAEGVADGLEDESVVTGHRRADDRVVTPERIRHRTGETLPALRASLDVAKEKRDRAGWLPSWR